MAGSPCPVEVMKQAMSAMQVSYEDPEFVAGVVYDKLLYGAHPYARKVRGSVASVEAIRRQDLVRFHQKGFDPAAITIVIVGDLDEEAAAPIHGAAYEEEDRRQPQQEERADR